MYRILIIACIIYAVLRSCRRSVYKSYFSMER